MTLAIDLDTARPALSLNGVAITYAPAVASVSAIIGDASRIFTFSPPAPPGHRNPQLHIYDSLGVTFLEDHFTFRVHTLTIHVAHDDVEESTPSKLFSGTLTVNGLAVATGAAPGALDVVPGPLQNVLGRFWSWGAAGFSLHVTTLGRRLSARRRSRVRRPVSLAICLPHNQWDASARPPGARLPPRTI